MEQNKTGKYLKYAIGEIVLVVIGILIALSINNWNEERKHNNNLQIIYTRIQNDIEGDIRNMSRLLEFHNKRKFVFEKVMQDSVTIELLDHGLSRIIATGIDRRYSNTGVNQLRNLNTTDSLSIRISNIYDGIKNSLEIIEDNMKKENGITDRMFRDNTDWYMEWITKEIDAKNSSQELKDYFMNNQEYKHRVAYMYNIIYNNYVRTLNRYKTQLENIHKQIEIKLQ